MQHEQGTERSLVFRALPWIVGAVALALYGLTLNPWVSFTSLSQVARLSGWVWTPELGGPAYYLVTLPLRWLSPGHIPLALNLLSAVCGALALAQLARAVALLPHDRTHEQRMREISEHSALTIPLSWLPPLLAVLACGLQLTFWEHATNGTGEMFDLLLFSYVVRSLLEYRVDGKEGRLYRAAFIHAVGMANNFAMVGFLPAFIAAVLWIRGLSFFHLRFLTRMVLCGLAGMLLYLLMPELIAIFGDSQFTFWSALKFNLHGQFDVLIHSQRYGLPPWKIVAILGLFSLLPVFVMAIRWASYFGDTSQLGSRLATSMFHVMHAFFLVACLWIAFDPPISPRSKGQGVSFLTFYWLGALSIGYFSGYFLLVFRPKHTRGKASTLTLQTLNRFARAVVVALFIVVPVGLVLKNLPQIRTSNGPAMKDFAAASTESLPKSGILLSDDWRRLLLAEAWLARSGRDKDFLFLETGSLKYPSYHRHLKQKHPGKWEIPPLDKDTEYYDDIALMNLALKLSKESELSYLHPSFGYYFEIFYPEAHGLVYGLKRYDKESLLPPSPTPENVAENEAFWSKAAAGALKPILDASAALRPGEQPPLQDRIFESLRVGREPNQQIAMLGSWCSRAMNYWGAAVQKLGQFEPAREHFEMALRLNPENVVAQVNLECNNNLRTGQPTAITFTKPLEERLGKYRTIPQILNIHGPYDEPTLCYLQAYIFLQTRLFRQSAIYFNRVNEFSPGDYFSRLTLAQIYLMGNFPDKALAITSEIGSQPERFHLNITNRAELMSVEVSAHFAKGEADNARRIIETSLAKNSNSIPYLATAVTLYVQRGDYTNGLAAVDRLLAIQPDNVAALIDKSTVQVQLKQFDLAISTLTHALALNPAAHRARLNRAIAYIRAEQLDKAKEDYQFLEKVSPNVFQVQFGLAEIAWRQKETNVAIEHYEIYLTNAPSKTTEAKLVTDRLKQLKGEKPD